MSGDKRARDRRHDAQRRLKPWRLWYKSARWKERAAAQLRAQPRCAMCDLTGEASPAVIADHVTPHRGNYDLFWNGRLQSLCKRHHDGVKQSMERSDVAGCDEHGFPLEKGHPWAQ